MCIRDRLDSLGTVLMDDYNANAEQGIGLDKRYGKRSLLWSLLSGINGDSVYIAVIVLVLYQMCIRDRVTSSSVMENIC